MLALAAALAEGLAAIHAADVAHRDLKPSNVLLAADGPRIIDFGIARAAEAISPTQPGMAMGSPGFMSPEQTGGKETGPPSDVFSPDGTRLATVSEGVTGTCWIPDNGVELTRLVHHSAITMITSPDSTRLINGDTDWTIRLWDLVSGTEISQVRHDQVRVSSPDRAQLATGGRSAVRLLDLATGAELARIPHGSPVPAMMFSPGGAQLAIRDGKTVALWAT